MAPSLYKRPKRRAAAASGAVEAEEPEATPDVDEAGDDEVDVDEAEAVEDKAPAAKPVGATGVTV